MAVKKHVARGRSEEEIQDAASQESEQVPASVEGLEEDNDKRLKRAKVTDGQLYSETDPHRGKGGSYVIDRLGNRVPEAEYNAEHDKDE